MSALQGTEHVLAAEGRPIAMAERGSAVESFVGLGAGVLAILGLIGVLPIVLLSVATIAVGAAFLIESAAVVGRVSFIMQEAGEPRREYGTSVSGVTMESVGGLAGVTLGILALIGLPDVLLPIAVIALGAATIFASGTISMVNSMMAQMHGRSETVKNLTHQMAVASADLRILAGLGGISLGVLAICHVAPLALTLIGILALGWVLFFESLSFSAGFANLMGRR